MIRITLRQSTRTVGAVSALGRLALVSYKRILTLVLATRPGVTPPIEVLLPPYPVIQLSELLYGRHR